MCFEYSESVNILRSDTLYREERGKEKKLFAAIKKIYK